MSVALSMRGAFGFGLQAEKGVFQTPSTWFPLAPGVNGRGETITLQRQYVVADTADSKSYQTTYYSAGEWVEGSINFPLLPGSLNDLLDWIQDRDSTGQGKWASVVVDCVNEVKKMTDVKVKRAVLDFIKGQPVMCQLDVCGLLLDAGSSLSPDMPVAAPYLFNEVAVEIGHGGDALAQDVNCEQIRLIIDTMLEDPAEGLRLGGEATPTQLYNLAGLRCSGFVTRDFMTNDCYADFIAGQEVGVALTMTRGLTEAVIALPRVLYQASNLGLPGSHNERIAETLNFIALGSIDGLTPPVTIA